jgi:serine/threonine protein kinase
VSPSPARSTPRRFFKRPFPPPSPAKHIKATLAKRLGGGKPKEGTIPEEGGVGPGGGGGVGGGADGAEAERPLDKTFGFGKNFGAKYELGKEVGRGHFGHTCSAVVKKGDYKGQTVAVKIISKAKVRAPSGIMLALC